MEVTENSRGSSNSFERILIIEAYTDANVGSSALVGNSLKILERKFPGAEIRVMAHDPAAIERVYHRPTVRDVFEYPFKQPRLRQFLWGFKTLFWMTGVLMCVTFLRNVETAADVPIPFRKKVEPFLWAELVVSVGAERLNDKYYKNVLFSLYTYFLVRLLGRRMVLFPQTSGPFFFSWTKWLTHKVLRNVDLVYTRDGESTRLLRDVIGLPRDKLIESVDVAVMETGISREEAFERMGIPKATPLVGISAMRWSYFKNRVETLFSNYPAYLREMARTIDVLIEKYKVTVVLFPTNFPIHGSREDDVTTCGEILSRVKRRDRAKLVYDLPTPSQLMGMLACCEVNITTRMHACILSTNAFVPTVSVNYLFKVREYMTSLGLGDFSIDIEEMNAERALAAFGRIWEEREHWRSNLRKAIGERKENLWKSMEALDALGRG